MSLTPETALVYDRIGANRRNSVLLLALLVVVLLPVALYAALVLTEWVVVLTGGMGGLIEQRPLHALVLAMVIAVALMLAVAWLEYRYASALLLRLAGARLLAADEAPLLWSSVDALCIGEGLPPPRLYVLESPARNAFSTGRGPESAALVVTRGLLDSLDHSELQGVVAHELSHIGNRDIRLGTLLAVEMALLRLPLTLVMGFFRLLFRLHPYVGLAALLYAAFMLLITAQLALSEVASDEPILPRALLALSVAFPIYLFVGAPAVGHLARLALFRQREFLADADSFRLTRDAAGLSRALAAMDAVGARQRLPLAAASSHLCIVDPLAGEGDWWETILSPHPPVASRVALLAGMSGAPPAVVEAAATAAEDARETKAGTEHPQPTGAIMPQPQPPPAADATVNGPFRLAAAAIFYADGDGARSLGELPAGALVVVLGSEAGRVRILAPGDTFGYIDAATPRERLELAAPPGETAPSDAGPGQEPEPLLLPLDRAADGPVRRGPAPGGAVRAGVLLLGLLIAFQLLGVISEWVGGLDVPCIGIC